jgi:OOP family OmpA-OmpF porin
VLNHFDVYVGWRVGVVQLFLPHYSILNCPTMKKILLCILPVIALTGVAQTEDAKWNVGIHGGFSQYTGDLGQGWYRTDQAAYSFVGFSVSRYLSRNFDVGVIGTRGEMGYMAPRDYSLDPDIRYNFLVSLSTINPFIRYNFTGREAFIRPYLFAGPSIIRQTRLDDGGAPEKPWEFFVPTGGAGISFRFGPIVSLQLQEMFMYLRSDDIDYRSAGWNDMYAFHTVGLTFNIPKFNNNKGPKSQGDIAKCPKIKTGPQRKDGEGKAKLDKERKSGWFRKGDKKNKN